MAARQVTLLELMVEWEHIPSTTFIALVGEHGFAHELFQWLCVEQNRDVNLATVAQHAKWDKTWRIMLSDDPYSDFDIGPPRTCKVCFRRLENHLTSRQVDEIIDAVAT